MNLAQSTRLMDLAQSTRPMIQTMRKVARSRRKRICLVLRVRFVLSHLQAQSRKAEERMMARATENGTPPEVAAREDRHRAEAVTKWRHPQAQSTAATAAQPLPPLSAAAVAAEERAGAGTGRVRDCPVSHEPPPRFSLGSSIGISQGFPPLHGELRGPPWAGGKLEEGCRRV